jgi:hypothetical protein
MRPMQLAKIPAIDVPDGHRIALFKRGSMGEIVGWYDSVKDMVEVERPFNPRITYACFYNLLTGKQKYYKSFNHQCHVKAKILPYAKNKATTEAA